MPQQLRFFANLWTMLQYPSQAEPWSLEEKFIAAKEAGFENMGGGMLPEVIPLCAKYGLGYNLYINADRPNWESALRAAGDYNPLRINIQLMDHDTPPAEAAALWMEMVPLADSLDLPMDLEYHRDTATETPEKCAEIRRIYRESTGREIQWSLDHSHFSTVKHLSPPFAARLLDPPDLMEHVRQIHFRPFNGHHAQIPATDGRGNASPEFNQYMEFAEALLKHWRTSAPEDVILYACPENGPRVVGNYGLSCFPDVWQDAIFTRDAILNVWNRLEKSRYTTTRPPSNPAASTFPGGRCT